MTFAYTDLGGWCLYSMLHDNSLAMYFTFFFKFSAKSLFPGSEAGTYLIDGDLLIDIAPRLKRYSVI